MYTHTQMLWILRKRGEKKITLNKVIFVVEEHRAWSSVPLVCKYYVDLEKGA